MIIATAIGTILNGLTVDVIDEGAARAGHPVSYHYGNQNELLLWLHLRHQKKQVKYPLVWYILNEYREHNGLYRTNARLIIMQNTKKDNLNTWRQSNSYTGIINPTWKAVKERLTQNKYLQVLGANQRDKFSITDQPNYGVSSGANNELQQTLESISTDIVDARVINFELEMQAECIINKNK